MERGERGEDGGEIGNGEAIDEEDLVSASVLGGSEGGARDATVRVSGRGGLELVIGKLGRGSLFVGDGGREVGIERAIFPIRGTRLARTRGRQPGSEDGVDTRGLAEPREIGVAARLPGEAGHGVIAGQRRRVRS